MCVAPRSTFILSAGSPSKVLHSTGGVAPGGNHDGQGCHWESGPAAPPMGRPSRATLAIVVLTPCNTRSAAYCRAARYSAIFSPSIALVVRSRAAAG
eukprot:scaffold14533_cov118-Isochrysis_galbana.AAC.8